MHFACHREWSTALFPFVSLSSLSYPELPILSLISNMSATNTNTALSSVTSAIGPMATSTPVSDGFTDTPAKYRFVHRPGGPVTINTVNANNPAITLHEVAQVFESVDGVLAFPHDMPRKPSDQPFTLANGIRGCFTEEVGSDDHERIHMEVQFPDGGVKGRYRIAEILPADEQDRLLPTRWTMIEDYDYTIYGNQGTESCDGIFRVIKVIEGSTQYVPVKLDAAHRRLFPRPQDSTTATSDNQPYLNVSETTPRIIDGWSVSWEPLSSKGNSHQDLVSYSFLRLEHREPESDQNGVDSDANVLYALYTVPANRADSDVICTTGPFDLSYE